jgi:hypothetical protein
MKNYLTTTALVMLLLISFESRAQFVIKGAQVTIKTGATLYTSWGLQNSTAGIVTNSGSIVSDTFITNNSGCKFSGNGTYKLQGNWKNAGTCTPGTSKLIFFGKGNSNITSGGAGVYDLQVDKNSNGILSLLDALRVLHNVQFLATKNWVQLNKNILTLDSNCTLSGYNDKKYFITNDSGFLKKVNVGNSKFTFPVGFSKSTYNPLSITEAGSADNYSVRSLQHALLNGGSGNAITNGGIDVSWVVREAVAGGVNATIETQWYPANGDELPGFDSTKCMVVRYKGTSWDYNIASAGSASGTTAKTRTRTGVTALGFFTVLSTANPTFQNAIAAITTENVARRDIDNAAITVYPTVVQNSLNISVKNNENIQTMNLTVVDEAGRTIFQKHKINFQSQQLSLRDVPSGLYMILIEYGGHSYNQKIIVHH